MTTAATVCRIIEDMQTGRLAVPLKRSSVHVFVMSEVSIPRKGNDKTHMSNSYLLNGILRSCERRNPSRGQSGLKFQDELKNVVNWNLDGSVRMHIHIPDFAKERGRRTKLTDESFNGDLFDAGKAWSRWRHGIQVTTADKCMRKEILDVMARCMQDPVDERVTFIMA